MSIVRLGVATLCVVLVAVVAACGGDNGGTNDGGGGADAGSGEPIQVGLNLELSGPGEFFGRAREIGALTAINEVNENGGVQVGDEDHMLEPVICDNRTEPTRGVTCAEEAAQEGVLWTIAPDAGFEAAYEIYKQEDIITLANGGVPSNILENELEDNPLLFSEFLTFPDYIGSNLSQLRTLYPDAETIATLVPDDENGRLWGAGFTANAEEYGFEVIDEQFHPADASGDFSSYLTSMGQGNPDIIYVSFLPNVSIPSIEQAADLDTAPIITATALSPEDILGLGFQGHEVVSFNTAWTWYLPDDIVPGGELEEPARDLISRFEEEAAGDVYPPSSAAASYISDVMSVVSAIEESESLDPGTIAEAMIDYEYEGPLGPGVMREEDQAMDLAQTTYVYPSPNDYRVEVFDSGFDEEPSNTLTPSGNQGGQ